MTGEWKKVGSKYKNKIAKSKFLDVYFHVYKMKHYVNFTYYYVLYGWKQFANIPGMYDDVWEIIVNGKSNEWSGATYFWKQINKFVFQNLYPKSIYLMRMWAHLNIFHMVGVGPVKSEQGPASIFI